MAHEHRRHLSGRLALHKMNLITAMPHADAHTCSHTQAADGLEQALRAVDQLLRCHARMLLNCHTPRIRSVSTRELNQLPVMQQHSPCHCVLAEKVLSAAVWTDFACTSSPSHDPKRPTTASCMPRAWRSATHESDALHTACGHGVWRGLLLLVRGRGRRGRQTSIPGRQAAGHARHMQRAHLLRGFASGSMPSRLRPARPTSRPAHGRGDASSSRSRVYVWLSR